MTGIYKITNNVTGEFYVGQSNDIERRWQEHKTPKNRMKQSKLAVAFRKYGIENFSLSILEECESSQLDNLEIKYIDLLSPTYNTSIGGKGNTGHIVSESTRRILSDYGKKQWQNMTEEQKLHRIKNNLKGPGVGHVVSEATRAKLRACNLGKKHPNKHWSPEGLQSLRETASKHSIGNSYRKIPVLAINVNTLDIEIFPKIKIACESLHVDRSHLSEVLKKGNHIIKEWWFGYLDRSVETKGDECSLVALRMSYSAKCVASVVTDEEIVHSLEMGNLRGNDKGFIQLAMRTGQYKTINAGEVYEGEFRTVSKLTGEVDFNGEKTSDKVVGYFCYFELLNGFSKTLYMTVEQMAVHAKRFSKGIRKDTTVEQLIAIAALPVQAESKQVGWMGNFHSMAIKTVIRLLLGKYGYLSIEMQNAIVTDQEGDNYEVRNGEIQNNQAVKEVSFESVEFQEVSSTPAPSVAIEAPKATPQEVDPGF